MKAKKNSMVFYSEWMEILAEFPADLRAKAYEAILRFAFYGEQPDDPDVYKLTASMRYTVAKNREKYEATCRRRAESGRKGGTSGRNATSPDVATTSASEEAIDSASDNTPYPAPEAVACDATSTAPKNPPRSEPEIEAGSQPSAAKATTLTDEEIANGFVEENSQAVEGFCCQQRISVGEFRRYACEVLSEWRLDAWKPQKIVCGGNQFQGRHLINQIRIKHQKRQQQTRTIAADKDRYDRLARRRGTETSARSAADYRTTF